MRGALLPCVDCAGPRDGYRRSLRCVPCGRTYYGWMLAANRAICRARAKGLLGAAAEHKCADCEAQAFDWDHRDYAKPLDVQPVCRSCNQRRGPALFPRDRTPEPAKVA